MQKLRTTLLSKSVWNSPIDAKLWNKTTAGRSTNDEPIDKLQQKEELLRQKLYTLENYETLACTDGKSANPTGNISPNEKELNTKIKIL